MNRGKIVNTKQNEKVLAANIHNKFDIEVIDANTGEVKQRAQGFNTICNNLWTRLFAPNNYFNSIHYGTGSGTPSPSDTKLFSYYSSLTATDSGTSVDTTNGIFSRKGYIQLTASTAVGVTITEVGIGYENSQNALCTHAMLQDMNGNPISIQKTDTDVINIYATIYIHFNPQGYDNGCIWFAGWNLLSQWLSGKYNSSSGYINLARADSYGLMGYYYSRVYRQDAVELGITNKYDVSTKTYTITASRMESSSSPAGGIRHIDLCYRTYSNGAIHTPVLSISTGGDWFPYTEVVDEAIGTGDGSTIDFAFDFGFVRDATIYVDGVEVPENDFTVDYGPLTTNNWFYHMIGIDAAKSTPDKLVKQYRLAPVNSDASFGPGGKVYFYNPCYEAGIGSFYGSYIEIFASNDLQNWYSAGRNNSNSGTTYINEEYVHYKYWYITNIHSSYSTYCSSLYAPSSYTGSKLHFKTPPAQGAVITANYKTDCIAKDSNYVFDFSLTIQVGEYVES